MAGAPEAGWYQDPGDASQHRYWDGSQWTSKTRAGGLISGGVEVSPRRSKAWILVAALVIVALVGTTVVLISQPGEKPTPTTTPTIAANDPPPMPTTDPSEVIVPEGWNLHTSETGVMSYAVPPEWTDISSPQDQDYVHGVYSEFPNLKSEHSGAWLLAGTYWADSTAVYVVSTSDGNEPRMLRYLAKGWASSDVDDIEYLLDEEYTTPRGYPGWRLDYTATYGGERYWESLVVLGAGTTVIYFYTSGAEDLDPFLQDILAVVDSIVVHHPPAES